jgi:hypothetical protein
MVDGLWDFWLPGTGGAFRIGAMTYWRHGRDVKEPRHLVVMTPAGIACLDCPVFGTELHWLIEGEPPNITVTPDLDVTAGTKRRWHGRIIAGELVDVGV